MGQTTLITFSCITTRIMSAFGADSDTFFTAFAGSNAVFTAAVGSNAVFTAAVGSDPVFTTVAGGDAVFTTVAGGDAVFTTVVTDDAVFTAVVPPGPSPCGRSATSAAALHLISSALSLGARGEPRFAGLGLTTGAAAAAARSS